MLTVQQLFDGVLKYLAIVLCKSGQKQKDLRVFAVRWVRKWAKTKKKFSDLIVLGKSVVKKDEKRMRAW